MADRTVTTRLVADTSGYVPGVKAATTATSGLSAAQKEAAASTKDATTATKTSAQVAAEAAKNTVALTAAKREATAAAKAAAAAETQANGVLVAAQKEAEAAAKDTTELGAARRAAAQEALESAQQEAAAAAETKAAADAQAKAATAALTSFREETAAARANSGEQAANAAATDAAAKKRADAYKSTGKIATTAGVGLVAAFALAEKATTDFDKSLSGVQAVSNASAADMDQLRAAALAAGTATAFTATEAADAEGELVKAGVSVKDVLGGALQGALSLAAAGNLGLADAATIAANAMNTFGLKGKDVSHIADVYAAAANKSAADVNTLAYAMQQGGLVAAQTGLSFEDTTAVLAAFADRGLQGADAGTSLKTMLEKLNAPTGQARSLMEQLGIVTYDASGKFVGITQLSGELHDKLGMLTDAQRNQALATIFGSDAIRAASVLYNLGADGVKGYSQAVNDQGAASRMAAEQMNNFSGDLKQLKGSIDVALIQGGSGANNVLRDMAQNATKAVNAFAGLPKWLQEASVGFAGGAGTSLLLIGGLSSIAGKALSTKKALGEVAEASSGMKGALASAGSFMAGPWGLAIAGAATVIGLFATQHHAATIAVGSFTDAIKEDGDAIGASTTKAVAADLASKGLFATFQKVGISSATVTDAALGNADALKQLTDATNAAQKADMGHDITNTILKLGLLHGMDVVNAYSGSLHDQLKAQQQATAATEDSTAATGTSAAETQKATQAAKDAAATSLAQAAGQRAVAEAENSSGYAVAAGTTKKKVSAAASKDLSAAVRQQAMDDRDSTTAQTDAAAAADKHTAALYKTAASAQAAADAAAKNKDSNADAAAATAKEAEAAAEASDVHQLGVRWLKAVADAEASATGGAQDLDSSVTDEVGAMQDAQAAANTLKGALDALNGVHISASRAAVDEQQKVADLTAALHDNGKTLDITTDAGRKNVTAINDLAAAANAHAQSVAEESGSIDAGNRALDASRQEFDAVLKKAGLTTGQIDAFNKSLLNTPKLATVTLDVKADTSAAAAALASLESKYGGTGIVFGGHHIIQGYSTGGLVRGRGTGTSDSNLIAASAGEYIFTAASVARIGLNRLEALQYGRGNTTVVKPTVPMTPLAGVGAAAGSSSGPALHVENYYENGSSPQAVAVELAWLSKSRGASW